MKVAQNDETNPDTQPVRPPRIPSIANTQLSPSDPSVRKPETPGILSRMFPPFVGITYYRVRAYLAPHIASLCFVMLCLLRIYCFFPPSSSPVDPETGADATEYDYVTDNPSSCTTKLPGKPPLDHQISPIPSLYCLH